jgi:hypothetical protein
MMTSRPRARTRQRRWQGMRPWPGRTPYPPRVLEPARALTEQGWKGGAHPRGASDGGFPEERRSTKASASGTLGGTGAHVRTSRRGGPRAPGTPAVWRYGTPASGVRCATCRDGGPSSSSAVEHRPLGVVLSNSYSRIGGSAVRRSSRCTDPGFDGPEGEEPRRTGECAVRSSRRGVASA